MHDWSGQFRLSVRLMMMAGVVWAGMLQKGQSDERPLGGGVATTMNVMTETPAAGESEEARRRAAAVTLNYSRAAFHRIRRNPSVRVLWEEQEKILNHLNLNGIADADIVKLYAAVLDEIAAVQLADRERELLRERYARQYQRDLSLNALSLTAQVVTAQYASAVRTGASSWWDFRTHTQNRELDLFRVDKERIKGFVDKSTQFLDISWRMARERNIPDRWLVRGDDLDKLEEAWRETDPTVRLRVLKRMEPFLECYPPYWYYLARTQQSLGQLIAASHTYARLAELGRGHFRKDEMLAAGLANRALILTYLGQPGAEQAAREALVHSTDAWTANLICASVLQRHRRFQEAEDAILRNLDVGLERSQSRVALVALYAEAGEHAKLAGQLADPVLVRELPPGLLTACACQFQEPPPLVAHVLQKTLLATPRYNFGRDDLVIQAAGNWRLNHAVLTLHYGEQLFTEPRISVQGDVVTASFEGVAEFSRPGEFPPAVLTIQYVDAPAVKVTLQVQGSEGALGEQVSPWLLANRRLPVYRLAAIEQDRHRLSLLEAGATRLPVTRPAGATLVKPTDDPYVTTPPIEIPAVSPL
uniref:Tetratricopeptide repeat protein n=1 Tax=Schlesneria paludicola TaxID=360056 RepID=A0A7C4QGC2_9PLAN